MKNLHLDLVRVTETGAIAAAEYVGSGDKLGADKAATDAIRERLNQIDFCAEIAIGEGKKDKSHGLFEGDLVGMLVGSADPEYGISIDPIEGTTPTANGGYEAMSTIALAHYGGFFKTDAHYMFKLAMGKRLAAEWPDGLDVFSDPADIAKRAASILGLPINRLSVCVMDRPRHQKLIARLRDTGVRIKLISDCDVTACIATCVPDSGVDLYLSAGGAPEAVLSAAAMKCMGGRLRTALADNEGHLLGGKVYEIDDLARGEVMFVATGITDGKLLKGVQFTGDGPVTHTIAMRSQSGTIRRITTQHGN